MRVNMTWFSLLLCGLTIVKNAYGEGVNTVFELEVAEANDDPEFEVALAEGWNLISAPLAPEDNDVPRLFRELVQRDNLTMVKNGFGRFYMPEFEFNNIPFWNFREGYLVKMSGADRLIVSGEFVEFDTPIPLTASWNITAYFPEEEVEVEEAFDNIADELILAKDGEGNFYLPQRNFNNIPPLRQGLGYHVKVER